MGQASCTEQMTIGILVHSTSEMLPHETARALLMNRLLTPRQQQVYDFIREKIVARGFGPTVREIGDFLKISSPNGVVCHLKALERKGMIHRLANKSRAIELTEIISRDKQYALPLGGRILGDLCSFNVDPGSTVELLRFIGEDRFAVKVVGDSLQSVHIAAGDALIIQRQATASAGQMVLAKMPNEGTQLVYWMPENNRVRLQSIDRKAAARFVESAEVVGVVVGLFREF
jgi:repressor LexA